MAPFHDEHLECSLYYLDVKFMDYITYIHKLEKITPPRTTQER